MPHQTVVSIFSGIGGFEAGFAAAGLRTIMMCEKDPSAQAVLRDHFADTELVDDVTTMVALPRCDILVGGWPCQDLSQAGRTAGLNGSQSGLISHVFRLLDAADQKPNTVVLENVAFALSLHKGTAVRHATDELARRGYRWAYRVLDTLEFGLPQRRRRVFICGMLDGDPRSVLFDGVHATAASQNSPSQVGFYWTEGNRGVGWTPDAVPPLKGGSGLSIPSPPAVWSVTTGAFHTPGVEDAERLQGFDVGWTAEAGEGARGGRVRWRLVGNAVSVPVAAWLGNRLACPPTRVADCEESGIERPGKHNAAWGGPGEATRYIASAGEGPGEPMRKSLADFGLRDAAPLSLRAAGGFLRRYRQSSLRKNQAFIQHLSEYCTGDGVAAH